MVSMGSPFLILSPQCLWRNIPASGSTGAPASLADFAMARLFMHWSFPVFSALKVYVFCAGFRSSGFGIFPPCASTILVIAPYPAPVVRSLLAILYPCPARAFPTNSSSMPVIQMLFLIKSGGALGSFFSA